LAELSHLGVFAGIHLVQVIFNQLLDASQLIVFQEAQSKIKAWGLGDSPQQSCDEQLLRPIIECLVLNDLLAEGLTHQQQQLTVELSIKDLTVHLCIIEEAHIGVPLHAVVALVGEELFEFLLIAWNVKVVFLLDLEAVPNGFNVKSFQGGVLCTCCTCSSILDRLQG
jgi:hypothetical protein